MKSQFRPRWLRRAGAHPSFCSTKQLEVNVPPPPPSARVERDNISCIKSFTQQCKDQPRLEAPILTHYYHLYMKRTTRTTTTTPALCIHHEPEKHSSPFVLTGRSFYYSVITTRLDYCNSLLFGIPKRSLRKLQKSQSA